VWNTWSWLSPPPLRRLLRSLPFIFFNCRLITMCKWDSLPPLNNHLVNFANNAFFSVCSCHLIASSSTESSPCRPPLRSMLSEHLFTIWDFCTFPHPHHLDSAGLVCVDLKHNSHAKWKQCWLYAALDEEVETRLPDRRVARERLIDHWQMADMQKSDHCYV